MMTDARALPPGSRLRADVLVVGTGPAGACLALELAGSGLDVLVLEGGGLGVEREARATLRGDTSSQEREPLDRVRDKRLGGTSHQWGGRTFPFDEVDFDGGPAGEPWPIGITALQGYYRRAARRLELGAYEFSARAALPEAPPHLLPRPGETLGDEQVWRFGPPVRFGGVLKRELSHAGTVRILHHANVVRLVQGAGGDIETVEFASAPGQLHRAHGRRVVLAVGALETVRLLLHSGVGDEHAQVGRHFMTHPVGVVGKVTLSDPDMGRECARYLRSHDGVWVRRMFALRPKVRRDLGLLNMAVAIWYRDARDPDHGDALLSAFALTRKVLTRTGGFKGSGMHRAYADSGSTRAHVRNVVTGARTLPPFAARWARERWLSRRTIPAFARVSARGEYALRFDAEQSADPANSVTLGTEQDAYGVPRLHVENEVSSADRRNYLRSLRLVAEELEASGFATVTLPSAEELEHLPLVDSTHQMGVVRMGRSSRDSVCDAQLRVWSAPNLYLATTGVFPSAGQAGPTLTLCALAIRLADHLVTDLDASEQGGTR